MGKVKQNRLTETIEPFFSGLGKLINNLNTNVSIDVSMNQICTNILELFPEISNKCLKIVYDNTEFRNNHFVGNGKLKTSLNFQTPDFKKGSIELFFDSTDGEKNLMHIEEINSKLKQTVPILVGVLSSFQLQKLSSLNVEREKELNSINSTTEILNKNNSLEESVKDICATLPQAMQYPEYTCSRIFFGGKSYTSKKFKETNWYIKQPFDTLDFQQGSIEIFYLKKFPQADEGPFLHEERSLINNLAALISGSASKKALQKLLDHNTERLKELEGLNTTSAILNKNQPFLDSLSEICMKLPEAWQFSKETVVRISYGDWVCKSDNFCETPWVMKQEFETSKKKKGNIEIYYLKEFPPSDEGPFLKEERNLLVNISNLIAGSVVKDALNKLHKENVERLKELKAINQTSLIIEKSNSIDETLQEICDILPRSWQYPRYTVARIKFEGKDYCSKNFKTTTWSQKEDFTTIDNKKGTIEIYYLKQFPQSIEGPFLQEERNLLINLGKIISGFLNNYRGREIYNRSVFVPQLTHQSDEFRKSLIKNKKPLQLYFNQQAIDKYVYLDMMKYKVKHILFVATLYDAFVLESEDSFFEKFMGEIYQFSLFSMPRVTGVSSAQEALELLETTTFDLVILMVGLDRDAPIELSKQIKTKNQSLPINLLLNNKIDIKYYEELVPSLPSIDKVFIWNGDSLILFSIVKSIEDKINVENDTKIGLVRVILLIEDSPIYYSKYLEILYSIVFGQVQQFLPDVERNELDKICKMRSRPKILLARNYDEAIIIFNKYKDFLLCVISDVEYERSGKMDKKAGIKFIEYVKSHIFDLPVILQSAEEKNEKYAKKLNVSFINKNSDTLHADIKKYLTSYLGFGNFTFRDKEGNKIGVAKTLRDFETLLKEVPDESFYVHASENQFSLWLMARGEIQLAKTLNPIALNQFSSIKESRKFFIDTLASYKEEKKKGKILKFEDTSTIDEKNIITFSDGLMGGKGRGLAFINTLINNIDFSQISNRINIISPKTVIIGTEEFNDFISKNKLLSKISDPEVSYTQLRKHFAEASLSHSLEVKLKDFVAQIDKPIAVRSSSTSEDSLTQPFAGVFDTYMIPNGSHSKRVVLNHLSTAIKLVYASVYSDSAKAYFRAIHHKIEEEKMAIVLQELVGSQYGDYYYPHISGVAQSYNYYSVGHMKPEEGYAVMAVGLGSYVVDGWKSYRFSPVYPKISMFNTKDLINCTQVKFYALDCNPKEIDFVQNGELASLKLLDISVAEADGALKHCVSVYNPNNDRVEPGLSTYGPRIVNFANILQYNYIPLADTIHIMLETVEEAFGSPVEIEFAVDLDNQKNGLPSFYLLQIKPLVSNKLLQNIEIDTLDKSQMLLFSKTSLGNGKVTNLTDIIYIDNKKFSKLKTIEMAKEIEYLNDLMANEDRNYVLIGPGRWGSRDQFTGIPVSWSQISNAKVIVEISIDNYPLDSSLGSHFFHNVTSMNIGYFAIQHMSKFDFVQWDRFENKTCVNETTFFKHIRFDEPFTVIMDGIKRTAAIIINNKND